MKNITIQIDSTDPTMIEACELLQWAINQQELRDYILSFENFYGTKCFLQTRNSNEWHLEKFLEADIWEAFIWYFETDSDIIAYVTPSDSRVINLNKKHMNRPISEVCNTIAHEFCHVRSMSHSVFNPGEDIWMQTAPYAIGAYVQMLVERKLGMNTKVRTFPIVGFWSRLLYKSKKLLGFIV